MFLHSFKGSVAGFFNADLFGGFCLNVSSRAPPRGSFKRWCRAHIWGYSVAIAV